MDNQLHCYCLPDKACHLPDFLEIITSHSHPPIYIVVAVLQVVKAAFILVRLAKGEDAFLSRIPLFPSDCLVKFNWLLFPINHTFAVKENKSREQATLPFVTNKLVYDLKNMCVPVCMCVRACVHYMSAR